MKKFYKDKHAFTKREYIIFYYDKGKCSCTSYWIEDTKEIIAKDIRIWAYANKVYHLFLQIF